MRLVVTSIDRHRYRNGCRSKKWVGLDFLTCCPLRHLLNQSMTSQVFQKKLKNKYLPLLLKYLNENQRHRIRGLIAVF